MESQTVVPSRNYLTKTRVIIGIVALAILLLALLIGALISSDPEIGAQAIWWSLGISLGINVLWGVPAVLLMGPYYRSLRYDIHEDQVIMHVGVVTQSVKYVPFRTVTNMTVKRDPLDRAFGIGSLEIQTAGISGTSEAEQNLVGLTDPDAVYSLAVQALRRYRGAMGPTTADIEEEDMMRAIFDELRAIREHLER